MTFDFADALDMEIARSKVRITKAEQEWDGEKEHLRVLETYRSTDLARPKITATGYADMPDKQWVVWIPPFRDEHWDGDAIMGPFGDTYWETFAEAASFLAGVLNQIELNQKEQEA